MGQLQNFPWNQISFLLKFHSYNSVQSCFLLFIPTDMDPKSSLKPPWLDNVCIMLLREFNLWEQAFWKKWYSSWGPKWVCIRTYTVSTNGSFRWGVEGVCMCVRAKVEWWWGRAAVGEKELEKQTYLNHKGAYSLPWGAWGLRRHW